MDEMEKDIIKRALAIEKEGYEFYMLAADNSDDEDVSGAFKQLAREEEKHMDWLRELYEKQSDKEDADLSFESPPETPSIFTWDNVSRFKGSMAMSVFGIGVKMEKDAVDFYEEAAERTESQEAEELFKVLADWERGHLQDFEKQYEMLQEDWWNEQGFAPF